MLLGLIPLGLGIAFDQVILDVGEGAISLGTIIGLLGGVAVLWVALDVATRDLKDPTDSNGSTK